VALNTINPNLSQTLLGPTFMFRIERYSVYAGEINKDFLY